MSPVYKAGYGIPGSGIAGVAPDGESVAFSSLGAFAGDPINHPTDNLYVARRGSGGWFTAPLSPPAAILPYGAIIDFSATLDASLTEGKPGSNEGQARTEGNEFEYLLHSSDLPDTAAGFEVAGRVLKAVSEKPFTLSYKGANADLSHIVFAGASGLPLLSEPFPSNSAALYELTTRPAAGEEPLQLVGLNNKGKPINPKCIVALGADFGKGSSFNAISAGGREIFFTTAATTECLGHRQLFVRIGGERTLEVSRPLLPACHEVPCEPEAASRSEAEFQGASEDGSRVFFKTSASLVGADKDEGSDLYMATIGCPAGPPECETEPSNTTVTSLTQISHDPHPGEPAEAQDLVASAQDGSHVYFVARGVLSEMPNAEHRLPIAGADNLYVYDTAAGGAPVFIADLCSGPQGSGTVEDPHCPAGLPRDEGNGNDTALWFSSSSEAQTNTCLASSSTCESGRFLLFTTYARLTSSDTDTAKDVYRYDAVTGALDRVSTGESGHDANGNNDLFPATLAQASNAGGPYSVPSQHYLRSRAITENGLRVVFTSAEPLSSGAVNRLANAYEWHKEPGWSEGRVSLVSAGGADEPVEHGLISQSGRDIFFVTTQGLVPQDTDGASDLYDARLEGGFPPLPAPRQPCSGDACQGPLSNPAPLLVPGSVSQAPGENVPPLIQVPPIAKKVAPKCPKGKKLRHGRCIKTRARRSKKSARRSGS